MADASTPVEPLEGHPIAEHGSPDAGQPDPFFSYSYLDGKVDRFDSKEDLERAWRDSHFREADYTRKTQKLSDERKAFDSEREKHQGEMKAFLDTKKRYDDMDAAYRGLSPQAQAQLAQLTQEPVGPNDLLDRSREHTNSAVEDIRAELQSFKDERATEQREKYLNDLMGQMQSRYEDFDQDNALEMLDALGDGNPEPLLEMVYWAMRGKNSGAVQDSSPPIGPAMQKAARLPRASGGKPKTDSGRKYASIDEAADAAMQEYAGVKLPN